MKTKLLLFLLLGLGSVVAQTYPTVSNSAVTVNADGTLSSPTRSTFYSKNAPAWSEVTGKPDVVTTTGSQTITGDKSFSGAIWGEMAAFVDATVSGTLSVTGNLQATSPTTTHLMTVFAETGTTGVGLLLYTSRDGVNFTPASKSWLYQVATDGAYGTFRDPKLLKFGDAFYVTFTTNFPAPYQYPTWPAKFGMIKSKDLIHWTNVTTPDLSAQLAAATPAAYIWTSGFFDVDGTKYVIAQTAEQPSVNYAVPFYPSATGTDTFGSPIQITGAFPSNKCTVSSIVKVGSTYNLQFSDYGNALDPGYISIGNMTSSSPFTGYAGPTLFIHNGEGAPTAVTNLDGTPHITPAGKYRVNFRSFAGQNQYIDTADFVSTTSAVTMSPGYGAASYVPGYTIRNVGITVANDLQTEQVLSALERDVVVRKVGDSILSGTYTISGPLTATNVSLLVNNGPIVSKTRTAPFTETLNSMSPGTYIWPWTGGGATLSAVSAQPGQAFFIFNRGNATATFWAQGSDVIYATTGSASSVAVAPGNGVLLQNDGVAWNQLLFTGAPDRTSLSTLTASIAITGNSLAVGVNDGGVGSQTLNSTSSSLFVWPWGAGPMTLSSAVARSGQTQFFFNRGSGSMTLYPQGSEIIFTPTGTASSAVVPVNTGAIFISDGVRWLQIK